MTEQELKRLSRAELLELLLEESRENEILREQLQQAKKQLASRRIKIENSGSIAEAALALNGVFEAAEEAATQYLENIKYRARQEYINQTREEEEQGHRTRKRRIKEHL